MWANASWEATQSCQAPQPQVSSLHLKNTSKYTIYRRSVKMHCTIIVASQQSLRQTFILLNHSILVFPSLFLDRTAFRLGWCAAIRWNFSIIFLLWPRRIRRQNRSVGSELHMCIEELEASLSKPITGVVNRLCSDGAFCSHQWDYHHIYTRSSRRFKTNR